jgi:hypothetical protein
VGAFDEKNRSRKSRASVPLKAYRKIPLLNNAFKGSVQRILRGVTTKLNQIFRPRKLEARPFLFLNFKGTPSQEEQKTIFSGLKINKMALSG